MSTNASPIVIVAARRTPVGSFQGALSGVTAPQLGAKAIAAAVQQAGVKPDTVDEVIMGCCLMAGLGQAPARQAAIAAGLGERTPATTLTKMCGSGMKTVMLAADMLRAGNGQVYVAGGMESMSQAPYLMPNARAGQRMGPAPLLDHMFHDGLRDAYGGELMGHYADLCAERLGFTREEQDTYATESVHRAQAAVESGLFDPELVPLTVKSGKSEVTVARDETPLQCKPAKIAQLKPAFREEGTITAASSASISDGAAALVLTREDHAHAHGVRPLARVIAHSTHAQAPAEFALAPIGAIHKLIERTGWSLHEVDLFEINEAFAVVALAAQRALNIPHERLNVFGGACALGHPIGATGARIIVTLINALRQRGGRRGIASLCIGGGEATAVAIEMC